MTEYDKIMDGFHNILKMELSPIRIRLDSLEQTMDKKFAAVSEEMNTRIATIESKIAALCEDNKSLHEDIKGLCEDNKSLHEDIKGLREEIKVLREDIKVLREDMEMEFAAVRKEMDMVYLKVVKLESVYCAGSMQDKLSYRLDTYEHIMTEHSRRIRKLEKITGIA